MFKKYLKAQASQHIRTLDLMFLSPIFASASFQKRAALSGIIENPYPRIVLSLNYSYTRTEIYGMYLTCMKCYLINENCIYYCKKFYYDFETQNVAAQILLEYVFFSQEKTNCIHFSDLI